MEIFRILISAFMTAVSCEISIHGGNYRLHEKHIIKRFKKHTSRLQCGQRCKYNDQCKSYSVNVALESCVLYDVHGDHDQRRSLISDALWEFYNARKVETEKTCDDINNEGQNFDQEMLGSKTYPAKSCLQIKQQIQHAASGFHWIAFNGNKFKGFCDMETDGGGWLMIASIQENEPNSFTNYLTDNVTHLEKLESGEPVVLGAAGMKLLKEETDAKQLRIYCKKERTIHIVTKNNTKGYDVINYFSDVTNTVRPQACDSFDILSDDDSIASRDCQKWNKGTNRWSNKNKLTSNSKLYDHTLYISSKNHIVNNRLCDDQTGDGSDPTIIGVWKYYIR